MSVSFCSTVCTKTGQNGQLINNPANIKIDLYTQFVLKLKLFSLPTGFFCWSEVRHILEMIHLMMKGYIVHMFLYDLRSIHSLLK